MGTITADALLRAGKLDEAIAELGARLRNDPLDVRSRTFLFELLCFAGAYDRAERQLDVLAGAGPEAEMGAMLYRTALHAERERQEMFAKGNLPAQPATDGVAGTLNGQPFTSIEDADARLGARLEIFAAGQYTWLPLAHIASIRIGEPKRLRDLLWTPATVQTGPEFQGAELGEVLIPVLTPLSWQDSDTEIRLGRVTDWRTLDDGAEVPIGQKLFLVDEEAVPILEIRDLVISPASP